MPVERVILPGLMPMKQRAIWTGHIRISLLTIPIRVYGALNESNKVSFNQLHKGCHQRLKQQLVCPVHGKVERAQVVKGYEIEQDKFVVLEASDLEGVKLDTAHTIELVQFIKPKELDPLYLDVPYFVAPDGPVSLEAFTIFREALRRTSCLGLGQVVLSGREKLVMLKPVDRGLVMTTLRYPAEVRQPASYFDDLADLKIEEAQLSLAKQLIQNRTTPFDPAAFSDRYQAALLETIKAKLNGAQPVQVRPASVGQVLNLVEALRQSVAETANGKSGLRQSVAKPRKIKAALAA
jgi:DNA end-binding protein Ku